MSKRDSLVRASWFDEAHTLLLLSPAIVRSLQPETLLGCIDGSTVPARELWSYEDGAGKMDTRFGVTAFGFRMTQGVWPTRPR